MWLFFMLLWATTLISWLEEVKGFWCHCADPSHPRTTLMDGDFSADRGCSVSSAACAGWESTDLHPSFWLAKQRNIGGFSPLIGTINNFKDTPAFFLWKHVVTFSSWNRVWLLWLASPLPLISAAQCLPALLLFLIAICQSMLEANEDRIKYCNVMCYVSPMSNNK